MIEGTGQGGEVGGNEGVRGCWGEEGRVEEWEEATVGGIYSQGVGPGELLCLVSPSILVEILTLLIRSASIGYK